jgi:hypothetical protein
MDTSWDWASQTRDVTMLDDTGAMLEWWAFVHTPGGLPAVIACSAYVLQSMTGVAEAKRCADAAPAWTMAVDATRSTTAPSVKQAPARNRICITLDPQDSARSSLGHPGRSPAST